MIEIMLDPAIWVSFLTLAVLEIVLGIDNIIFISIAAERLPPELRPRARLIGLALALAMRIALLLSITWLIKLTTPIVTVMDFGFSWRDLILFGGGLFLLAKGTIEIYETVEGSETHVAAKPIAAGFTAVIVQIVLLDLVFSFDSILTAIGLTDQLLIMIAAITVAMVVMLLAARPLSDFVNRHLSIKILALAFLLLIGAVLVADGLHFHIPKGYIYFSLAFSVLVQALILLAARRKAGAGGRGT